MANELDWLRSKAKAAAPEVLTVSLDEATSAEIEAGTYSIQRFIFQGTIPVRMARALRGCRDLVKTDLENEVLFLGNGYRGGERTCEFHRTVYTKMEIAA